MIEIIKQFWPLIAPGILSIYFFVYGNRKKREGREEVEAKRRIEELRSVGIAKRIDNDIDNLDSDSVNARLQKYNRRD